MKSTNSSRELSYPSSRQFTFDLGKIGRSKHHVKALLEIDVTDARKFIRRSRLSGEKLSFLSWIIKVTADTVSRHPAAAGINRPRKNKTVIFEDIDISIIVEKNIHGKKVPLPYLIRKADKKTPSEIFFEIESAKTKHVEDEKDYVLSKEYNPSIIKLFLLLPQWIRLLLTRLFMSNPYKVKKMMGTVVITTAGMAGSKHGWIIPYSMHSLSFALGSINLQPVVYKNEICKREILHLTALIDHDVIDGVPAALFIEEFVKNIETPGSYQIDSLIPNSFESN